MDGLVRFSFYAFAASSMAIIGAAIAYMIFGIGRVRVLRHTMATSTGHTVTSSQLHQEAGPVGFARWGLLLSWFGMFFAGVAIVTRWIAAGHFPISNMYEYSLVFLFSISLMYIVFESAYGVRQLGAIVLPIAALMSLYIWSLDPSMREVNPLIPALQTGWIMPFHVGSFNLAYATFAVAFAAAILFLIADRTHAKWLPSPEMLDDIAFRAVSVGFPLFTLGLILGSVWAHEAWGTYWQWDPKETAALFTWLVYGVYLHTRTLRGWRGRRSAWVLLFGFGATAFTYYGNYFFGGLHAYGGI